MNPGNLLEPSPWPFFFKLLYVRNYPAFKSFFGWVKRGGTKRTFFTAEKESRRVKERRDSSLS
jgi:hypothetical protein